MARITGYFRVEEVEGLSREGRACVRLLEPLSYHVGAEDSLEVITVPAGFVTDFASSPFGTRNTFPALGPWSRAAIIHDYGYSLRGALPNKTYSRKEIDDIFLEAMTVLRVPAWKRSLMYRAVRLFGERGWGG